MTLIRCWVLFYQSRQLVITEQPLPHIFPDVNICNLAASIKVKLGGEKYWPNKRSRNGPQQKYFLLQPEIRENKLWGVGRADARKQK